MKLSPRSMRIFKRVHRKYNVSIEFLKSNMVDIRHFLLNAMRPHLVMKIQTVRKPFDGGEGGQKVILNYHHPQRYPPNLQRRKIMIKRHKRNMQQWSKRMVVYLKSQNIMSDFVKDADEELSSEMPLPNMAPEEVSKQLKEQLELLRSGKRIATLIEGAGSTTDVCNVPSENRSEPSTATDQQEHEQSCDAAEDPTMAVARKLGVEPVMISESTDLENNLRIAYFSEGSERAQENMETTPEKQIVAGSTTGFLDNLLHQRNYKEFDEKTEEDNRSCIDSTAADQRGPSEAAGKTNSNFLDMLMSKVRVRKASLKDKDKSCCEFAVAQSQVPPSPSVQHNDSADFTDSSEEFLGFEETERIPGMLMTPLVPYSKKNPSNSAFVSESLNQYMRENLLESSYSKGDTHEDGVRRIHRQANFDGLVTPSAIPPNMSMPAVPESLLRLRTVAERRQFLQKFSKNHKLSIINNEATIYRELQRKIRQQKVKSAPLQMLQAPGAQMPFTRQGWQAASFVVTDYNKYFYQVLQVDGGAEYIKLPGVCGNNESKMKKPYLSRVPKGSKGSESVCTEGCFDLLAWRDFKPVKTYTNKAKLNKNPFRPIFPPCPLSQKPFQKPLDDETAALLLAGGSMAVVRMPTVELEVFPEVARPLHEVAKRYLQYILPHHDISREWAEFSVSTLQHQLPRTVKEAEMAAAAANAAEGNGRRKSFTFAIPYLNDRNHILVRRVVDRSEQLDRSFEESRDTSNAVAELSFRSDCDPADKLLQECADVVTDMINSVAISCSENSFIKDDPHGVGSDNKKATSTADEIQSLKGKELDDAAKLNGGKAVVATQVQSNKKQKSLLLELRRLNATIIDAGTKPEKAAEPCNKDHCSLGCVCSSLADEYPLRQHCGKSKCIIDCHCKISKNARIMRLETDGRCITTEDAFLLRRKATARLARMEKEFTSTIVLTGNETLLINESHYDKKRRCTKAPKRYDDFTDADDDYQISSNLTPPKSSGAMVAIDTATSPTCDDFDSTNTQGELATELREPIYIKDTILSELKHCTVVLRPLQDTKNMAVWCMVHELYKCFCGGRATEGKPLTIEKEEENSTIATTNTEADYVVAAPRARYSFDKFEMQLPPPLAEQSHAKLNQKAASSDVINNQHIISPKSDTEENEIISSDDDDLPTHNSQHDPAFNPIPKRGRPPLKVETRGRPMEGTIIRDYMNAKLNWCRRVIAVPMKTYTRRNRKRVPEVLESIKRLETAKTQLILNEHILRSVYYHKHEFEKSLKAAREKEQQIILAKSTTPNNGKPLDKPKPPSAVDHVVPQVQDDDDVQFVDDNSLHSLAISDTSSRSQRHRESRKRRRAETMFTNYSNECQETTAVIKKPKLPPNSTSIEANTSESVSAKPSESVFVKPPESVSVNPSECVSVHPSEPLSVNPSECVSVHPSEPLSVNPSECVSVYPSEPLSVNPSESSENIDRLQSPKIDNFLSVNQETVAAATEGELPAGADVYAATAGAERQTAADLGLIDGAVINENFREFYNVVIKNMNNLVSKKMQDIDMALKRESKVIPPPNEEILCIIKWSNFLDAFVEGYVFIWQVQMEKQERPFFAATITNLMPMILGAVGVVNIAALNSQQLPLIGRMLLNQCRNKETIKLAVVMQGRSKYWLVKGFLHPDSSKACAKPTPETHPVLTQKINVLCSLLVKQRVKEHQRKLEQQQQQPTSSNQEQQQQQQPTSSNQEQQQQQQPTSSNLEQQQQQPTSSNLEQQQQQPTSSNQEQQQQEPTSSNSEQQQQQSTSSNQEQPEDVECLENRPVMAQRILPTLTPFIPVLIPVAPPEQEQPLPAPKVTPSNPETNYHARKQHRNTLASKKNVTASKTSASPKRRTTPCNSALLRNIAAQHEFINTKSNIEFRKVTSADIDEIQQPELLQDDHRWLVLDLRNDFSHIFVPDFSELVSLDRIQKVMAFSRQKKKIVKLQFFQNAPFDAYVTPLSWRNIYFGPLKFNMRPPLLILLQSVDGLMMLREVFQMQHNIQTEGKQRTTAFWILQVNGQIKFEIENLTDMAHAAALQEPLPEQATGDSDDDCVIVEDENDKRSSNDVVDVGNLATLPYTDPKTTCSIASNTPPLAVNPPLVNNPVLSQTANLHTTTDVGTECVNAVRMNFTIQAVDNNNKLQITPNAAYDQPQRLMQESSLSTPSPVMPLTMPLPTTTTTQQMSGFVPLSVVITNVAAAPKEAPYSSTIYVSNVAETLTNVAEAPTSLAEAPVISSEDADADRPSLKIAAPYATEVESTTTTTQCIGLIATAQTNDSAKTDSIAQCKASAIKRRRISLRCPIRTDMETKNIAIDAAIKLLPECDDAKEACCTESEDSATAKQKKNTQTDSLEDETQMSTLAACSMTTMLRPNTTITKIKTSNANITAANQNSPKATALKSLETSPKLRYLLPKRAAECPNKSLPQLQSANAAPIVFDVNFVDGSDEPAASIVIKPSSTTTSTTPAVTSADKSMLSAVPPATIPCNSSSKTASGFNAATTIADNSCSMLTNSTTLQYAPTKTAMNVNQTPKVRVVRRQRLGTYYQHSTVKPYTVSPNLNTVVKSAQAGSNSNLKPSCNSNCNTTIITWPKKNGLLPMTKVSNQTNSPGTVTAKATSASACRSARLSLPSTSVAKVAPLNQSPKRTAVIIGSVPPQRRSLPVAAAYSGQVDATSTRARLSFPSGVRTTLPTKHTVLSVPPGSLASKNSPKAIQQGVQYGYIVANIAGLHKFVVKRVGSEYLIRVPNFQGILKLNGMGSVSSYLNKHILKTVRSEEILKKMPAIWRFIPQDRLNAQRQKVLTNVNVTAKQNLTTQCVPTPVNCVNSSSVASPNAAKAVAKVMKNAAATPCVAAAQEPCDTILIED